MKNLLFLVLGAVIVGCASKPKVVQIQPADTAACQIAFDSFLANQPGVERAAYIKRVQPEYPAAAMLARREGCVVLSYTTNKEGKASDVQIVEENPKGFFFADSAIKALYLTEFAKIAKKKQVIKFDFDLEEAPAPK